ncbi:hypothetical protein [Halomicronema sp. CCY15110]|uniref:hypothetical protein n=1 Tax=Halomicronema sp. CCY15110 TaxID=2767773 RepID=UPI0019506E40|nr:hypothetical protein [Halomicronema sp. CCY15110]
MFDLLAATRDYWKQLDHVEAAYHRGELSAQEVNTQVHDLMAELGDARRQAFKDVWASLQVTLSQQRDAIAGTVAVGLLAYLWLATLA